mgnify:FL=1
MIGLIICLALTGFCLFIAFATYHWLKVLGSVVLAPLLFAWSELIRTSFVTQSSPFDSFSDLDQSCAHILSWTAS